jgi:hypothetical protein
LLLLAIITKYVVDTWNWFNIIFQFPSFLSHRGRCHSAWVNQDHRSFKTCTKIALDCRKSTKTPVDFKFLQSIFNNFKVFRAHARNSASHKQQTNKILKWKLVMGDTRIFNSIPIPILLRSVSADTYFDTKINTKVQFSIPEVST